MMDMHTRLSFGKHKGTKLGEVPVDYLDWMVWKLTGDDGFRTWAAAAKAELKRRRKVENKAKRKKKKKESELAYLWGSDPKLAEALDHSTLHSATHDNPHPDRNNANRKAHTMPNGKVAHIPADQQIALLEECPF